MSMVYRSKNKPVIDDEQAQRYGERIAQLELQNRDNSDLPGIIIDDARNESSPLNDYFEWDKDRATYLYHRHQAQNLLVSIEVQVINPKTEEVEWTRGFHPVEVVLLTNEDGTKETTRTWTTKERILAETDLRRQIIEKAMRELETWRKTYEQYTELSSIFSAIDDIKVKHA